GVVDADVTFASEVLARIDDVAARDDELVLQRWIARRESARRGSTELCDLHRRSGSRRRAADRGGGSGCRRGGEEMASGQVGHAPTVGRRSPIVKAGI